MPGRSMDNRSFQMNTQARNLTSRQVAGREACCLVLFDEHNNDKIRDQARARNDLLIPLRLTPAQDESRHARETKWFSPT
jgi:hypothetical protein